jgi:hypothetical protein
VSANSSLDALNRFCIAIDPLVTAATWDIDGSATVPGIRSGSNTTMLTKTGAGVLNVNGTQTYTTYQSNYKGAITVAEGELAWNTTTWSTVSSNRLAGMSVAPGIGVEADVKLTGTGIVNLASGGSVNLTGTSTAKAILSPAGNGLGTFSVPQSNTGVVFNDNSILAMDVSSATASSDKLAARSLTLNSGSTLAINAVDGNLGSGIYFLASTNTPITGSFGKVLYNGIEVTDPMAANSIGGSHFLYTTDSLMLLVAGDAQPRIWNSVATDSMGDAGSWDIAPAFNGDEALVFPATSSGTITLDGNRLASSIFALGNYVFASGSEPSTLTLTTLHLLMIGGSLLAIAV